MFFPLWFNLQSEIKQHDDRQERRFEMTFAVIFRSERETNARCQKTVLRSTHEDQTRQKEERNKSRRRNDTK